MKKRVMALCLVIALTVASLTACGAPSQYDTLVIGTTEFDGVFNPLFSSSGFDSQVNDLVFASVCNLDKDGVITDHLGSVESTTNDDGSVLYTVKLDKGNTFSDGVEVTIDDLLFTYYVYADPTYDGSSTFSTLDIQGMKEYYYDSADYTEMVAETEAKYSLDAITEEDFIAYLLDTDLEGWWDGSIDGQAWEGESWAQYLLDCGFTQEEVDLVTTDDEMEAAVAKAEWLTCADAYDPLAYYIGVMVSAVTNDGIDVPTITGINKVDDYTCTVLFNTPNISGDKLVAWQPVVPEHIYGTTWTKGDLSSIKALNATPVGAGAYTYVSYENNMVTLAANETYFKGAPQIPFVKLQVVNEEDKVDLVLSGEIDISDPSPSLEIIAQMEETDAASYTLVDNPGYGYIGINAGRVTDLNIRKGLMCLINRGPAVSSFYGDLAEVIERPMTPTVAEYPKDAKEYYGYDPAKALEYFQAAGYVQEDGKLVKDGEQLVITVGIGEASSHPSTPILTQMANDMADLGAELIVNDLQFSVLSSQVQSTDNELDMWVMAWGNSTDCDLTQIFGSNGGSNYQHYYDSAIDDIQAEILQTIDFDARAKLVEEELDMIMEAAIYMPVYQRKNMEIYNNITVKTETLPEETTTYHNYVHEIETIEMN